MLNWLQRFHALEASEVLSAIYRHQDEEAVRHLMRVACGLDSPGARGAADPGADQAILRPRPAGGCGERIQWRLFQKSFSVAKRVRTDTGSAPAQCRWPSPP